MVARALVNENGFTVLYEGSQPAVEYVLSRSRFRHKHWSYGVCNNQLTSLSLVFVHGFTGHPKDTWTLRAKRQPNNTGKRPVQDELGKSARRSKIPRLFGRSSSALCSTASSAAGSPGPSRTPTAHGADGSGKAVPVGQQPQDIYWPEDLACQTIPNSRILTFGYDTKVRHWLKGSVSKKTVYDHAWEMLCGLDDLRRSRIESRRPIVFVAHSLGGIVVKEALRRARVCQQSKPQLYSIFEKTSSIIFFGTPHRGADPGNLLHHLLAASAQAFGAQVNQQIVDTLMPNSERLTELRDEFPAMCQERTWSIYSFQEEYGMRALFGTKVVEDQSSCLNIPALETPRFISSNHMDMCRFSGLQDPEYGKVAAVMERILETIEMRSQESSRATDLAPTSHDLPVDEYEPLPPPQQAQNKTGNTHQLIAEETKASLIEQLYFTKIDERLTSLTPAQGRTCRWFLSKPQYISWRNPDKQPGHGSFLWIKGNPGTGKSTLMKFLFENVKSETKGDPSQITLSFFFLARGVLEEKSTSGLYRSLLHQLFQRIPDLQDSLEWMTADGARGIQTNGWNEQALKQTFRHALPELESRALTIFVDALDECDDTQARDMVSFFEELCDVAQGSEVRLSRYFGVTSSRQYR